MPEPLLIAAVLCLPLVGLLVLQRAGAFVVAEQAAFLRVQRRLRRERRPDLAARLQRGGLLRRLDEARDLRRLLVIAGDDSTPGVWGLRVAGATLLVLALLIVVNAVAYAAGVGIVLGWPMGPLLLLLVPVVAVLRLRLAALRTRQHANRAFGEVAAVLAAVGGRPPLRNPAALEGTDLVAMVAAWVDDPSLRAIVEGNRWRRLCTDSRPLPASEAEWFARIGELYEISAAARLAEVVRISRELNPRDVSARYLQTARDLSRERLADLRARNRRAMVTQVVPMIGLVAALMILVLSAVVTIHLGGS